MRNILRYKENKDIPPLNKREWNYYFLEGERVKIIPEMYESSNLSDPTSYSYIDSDLVNKVGVVKRCWCELHSWAYGSSYLCDVEYDSKTITLLSMFFYTSKKFYNIDICERY